MLINVLNVGDLYVTVMAGRWIRLKNGRWEFKIDMSRTGRSINCRNVGSWEELRVLIASAYTLDAKLISVEMSYWLGFGIFPSRCGMTSNARSCNSKGKP